MTTGCTSLVLLQRVYFILNVRRLFTKKAFVQYQASYKPQVSADTKFLKRTLSYTIYTSHGLQSCLRGNNQNPFPHWCTCGNRIGTTFHKKDTCQWTLKENTDCMDVQLVQNTEEGEHFSYRWGNHLQCCPSGSDVVTQNVFCMYMSHKHTHIKQMSVTETIVLSYCFDAAGSK